MFGLGPRKFKYFCFFSSLFLLLLLSTSLSKINPLLLFHETKNTNPDRHLVLINQTNVCTCEYPIKSYAYVPKTNVPDCCVDQLPARFQLWTFSLLALQ